MDKQKNLVIVSNGITPYGIYFLERVATELKSFRLRTLFSYEFSTGNWPIVLKDSINALIIGRGEGGNKRISFRMFFRDYRRGIQLVREIKAFKASVVMILGYSYISHLVVIEWCKISGIPCLMWGDSNIMGDNSVGLKASIKKLVVSRAVSRCSAILPCGRLGSKYFQKYGADPKKIFLVPNEPDYSIFENVNHEYIQYIARVYNLRLERHRIIYSGRLIDVKRVDILIDAFIKLSNKRLDWDLIIVGNGPLEAKLKALVPNSLRNRIFWTGFVTSTKEVAALYKLSDVLVLPSDYEAWAVVINEAVCSGLAIVSSSIVGAAEELVRDGENGKIFEASNSMSLIEALLDVTDNKKIDYYKSSSKNILRDWRQIADPIDNFRKALKYALNDETVH